MNISTKLQKIPTQLITPENFLRYGQMISASKDGKTFDEQDAQLSLDKGIPRFYIMRLHERGRKFHTITRHNQCTQCLGSLEGKEWFMAVCPPNHQMDKPDLENMAAFRIPGNCFIKLAVGTWHAGPYFDYESVDFYNLELSDTNIVDHFTHDFLKIDNLEFEMV
ncbi:MAG: ureidoglycolate lyase [Mastigocoleus sp.]